MCFLGWGWGSFWIFARKAKDWGVKIRKLEFPSLFRAKKLLLTLPQLVSFEAIEKISMIIILDTLFVKLFKSHHPQPHPSVKANWRQPQRGIGKKEESSIVNKNLPLSVTFVIRFDIWLTSDREIIISNIYVCDSGSMLELKCIETFLKARTFYKCDEKIFVGWNILMLFLIISYFQISLENWLNNEL